MPTFLAVRTMDQLYVEWYRGDQHEYELVRPAHRCAYELTNLVADPAWRMQRHRSTIEALQKRLEELARARSADCRN